MDGGGGGNGNGVREWMDERGEGVRNRAFNLLRNKIIRR